MTGADGDDYGDAGRPGYGGGGGHRGGKLSAGPGTTPSDYGNGGEDYGEGKVTGGGDTATQELPSPHHHGHGNGNDGAEQLKYPSY